MEKCMSDELKIEPTPIEYGHTIRIRRTIKETLERVARSFRIPVELIEIQKVEFKEIRCPCIFKDKECGYTGKETQCDKTFASCAKLDNTHHFRGWLRIL